MGDHNRNWQRYSDVQEIPRWAVFTVIALLLVALVIALLIELVYARWSPQLAEEWGDVDESTRSWFRGVRSPHGVPCCDIADGHKTTWRHGPETELNSGYEVPVNDEWMPVPKAAIIYKTFTQIKKEITSKNALELIENAKKNLLLNGFSSIDYFSLANAQTLEPIDFWNGNTKIVILVAAFTDGVRLIDNMVLN